MTLPVHLHLHLHVNGTRCDLTIDPRVSVLDALRDHLGIMSVKRARPRPVRGLHGAAGRRRVLACLSLAVSHDGATVITAEGLGSVDHLHPLHQAFIHHDGLQCGYCTPGQICSAVDMLDEFRRSQASHVTRANQSTLVLTDDEIRERMRGILCRLRQHRGGNPPSGRRHRGRSRPSPEGTSMNPLEYWRATSAADAVGHIGSQGVF